MERARWPALGGLLIGSVVLTTAVPRSFAFDRPIHSTVAVLASAGSAVILLSRWLPKHSTVAGKGGVVIKGRGQYEYIPLHDTGHAHSSRQPSPNPEAYVHEKEEQHVLSLKALRCCFLLLFALLCLRAEVLRQVVDNVQCVGTSWSPIVPIFFAIWDYFFVQRSRARSLDNDADSTSHQAHFWQKVIRAPYAYVLATTLISGGGMLALSATASPASTYICAAATRHSWLIPHLQHMGTLLDTAIIFCIAQLLTQDARGSRSIAARVASVGWAFLFTACFWLIVGAVYWFVQETGREWLLTIPRLYLWSVWKLGVYVSFTLICASITIMHIGILLTVTIITVTITLTITTSSAWANMGHPFPDTHMTLALLGMFIFTLGLLVYSEANMKSSRQHVNGRNTAWQRLPSWLYACQVGILVLWTALAINHHRDVTFHPIDTLRREAQGRHDAFVNQSASSRTLPAAVKNYEERYHRPPPPHFDAWYHYATARNTVIIDDWDSIYQDLLPFYGLTPQEIRERTWALISNPWNDAAGIMIRSGVVTIAPNVVPTHKWMLDGIVEMISQFADKLPDMDLAFNLNDEPRVSVPYETCSKMRSAGDRQRYIEKPQTFYSPRRTSQWKPVPEEPNHETPLWELSWQPIFHRFGNQGCPPNSRARTERIWDTGSFCHTCAAPHSLGAFLANWTLAADVCYQPDLHDLHGLYMSPAAFKATHALYPVFSQSKAHGFNDILYPSAWNYIRKVSYDPNDIFPDPPFSEKVSTLFWRGATSEGVAHGDPGFQWLGMARQRFVNLLNPGSPSSAARAADPSILLPSAHKNSLATGGTSQFSYVPLSRAHQLKLSTDVHLVSIARCFGPSCATQEAQFGPLSEPIDFQQHWQYKYLLDLDGAGFSGRFLSFLHSRSLPFKAALFREWWDGRVTPWVHFVPLDLRGQGVWATLAYFMSGKEREAERMATAGKQWAEQVLRKEDMEIYFFRLLLEWGRLTDDRREVLGFVVGEEEEVVVVAEAGERGAAGRG